MKTGFMVAVLVVVLTAGTSWAANPYLGVAGGVSVFHDSDSKISGLPPIVMEYDSGFGFSGSLGYRFDNGRIEGEFGYRKADVSKLSALGTSVNITGVDATVKSYMINGFYDMPTDTIIKPYLGGGIGLMNYELNDNGSKNDADSFGYQLIAGLGFELSKTVTLDFSYRLQGAASDFENGGDTISYMSSSLFGGMRINF